MSVKPLFNERELLLKIADGDQRAFGMLFEEHQQLIFNIALKLTRSRSRSKEVVQDVFLKIWNKRTELLEIDNFGAFINRVARNKSIDALRVIAREALRTVELQEAHLETGDTQTEKTLEFQETTALIKEALASLTPQQRRAYQLCHEMGLKYEEAATEMGISPGTVQTHMKLALRNIRKYLNHLEAVLLLLYITHK
jgi:RNA polymerase sigma-70 factor (family 1)